MKQNVQRINDMEGEGHWKVGKQKKVTVGPPFICHEIAFLESASSSASSIVVTTLRFWTSLRNIDHSTVVLCLI